MAPIIARTCRVPSDSGTISSFTPFESAAFISARSEAVGLVATTISFAGNWPASAVVITASFPRTSPAPMSNCSEGSGKPATVNLG